MSPAAERVAWIAGIVGAVAVVGGVAYAASKPSAPSGGGAGGGSNPTQLSVVQGHSYKIVLSSPQPVPSSETASQFLDLMQGVIDQQLGQGVATVESVKMLSPNSIEIVVQYNGPSQTITLPPAAVLTLTEEHVSWSVADVTASSQSPQSLQVSALVKRTA